MAKRQVEAFLCAASFIGECCPRPHLWVEIIRARSGKAAAAKLRETVEQASEGGAVGDVAVIIDNGRMVTFDDDATGGKGA